MPQMPSRQSESKTIGGSPDEMSFSFTTSSISRKDMSGDTSADGDWRIQGDFAPALLDKGIASTRRQLEAWHADGITDAELTREKTQFAGNYQVGLATSGGMAGTILVMLNRGMPLEFVDEYPARVKAITRDQVNIAIRKHLDPATMTLVKAGTVGTAGGAPAAK